MYVFIFILAPAQELGKWEMNILIKNPEIVFVADMTRNDAPALVITTQCEICCKGEPTSNTVTDYCLFFFSVLLKLTVSGVLKAGGS